MTFSTRVQLVSEIEEDDIGLRVSGATLAFESLGEGKSKGKAEEPQAAKLKFFYSFLEGARNMSEPEFQEFASLEGEFLLRGEGMLKQPIFLFDPAADFNYQIADPEEGEPFRAIALKYDDENFDVTLAEDSAVKQLRLPKEEEQDAEAKFRFLEVAVELEVGGAAEAQKELNDRIDLPLRELEKLTTQVPLQQFVGVANLMSREKFLAWVTDIFGDDIPHSAYESLRVQLIEGAYSMPPIEVLTSLPEGNVAGFNKETKTIQIKRAFIKSALDDEEEAAALMAALIEEFGHFIDDDLRNRLSKVGGDADEDEGAKFGYSICNLKWDIEEEAAIAEYFVDPQKHEIIVKWPSYKQAVEEMLGPEEQRSDTMKDAIEFFGAGEGHGKPGQSFGHESIENDALKSIFPSADERKEIYFGNWLRDYSQAITPLTVKFVSRAAITEALDIYARSKFADVAKFRVTESRLGVYRAEEHIDNPTGLKTAAPIFNRAPTARHTAIDSVHQRANYIATTLPKPDISGAQYMENELIAAINQGPTAEGRRRLGQALHTLEDFYAHSNFCELAVRAAGKTKVEPWTSSVTAGGKTFFPLVTGNFGGDDTAASIFLALGEVMEADLGKACEAGTRTTGVKIALVLMRDYKPHMAKQAEAAIERIEELKKKHPKIATLSCKTIGMIGRAINFLIGSVIRIIANQIDEYQTFTKGVPGTNPTHTQLAKDHDDHVFHVLAAQCAMIAVTDIASQVNQIWTNAPLNTPANQAKVVADAKAYFVHPDFLQTLPNGKQELDDIVNLVDAFVKEPANAAALKRAESRTVLDQHLNEALEYANKVTNALPIERLKQIFGIE